MSSAVLGSCVLYMCMCVHSQSDHKTSASAVIGVQGRLAGVPVYLTCQRLSVPDEGSLGGP